MYTVKCRKCSKEYQKNDHVAAIMTPICYDCALAGLTFGSPAQEWQKGHAKLQSGQILDSELNAIYFQQDGLNHEDGGKNRRRMYEEPEDGEPGTLSFQDMEDMYGHPEGEFLDDEDEESEPESEQS